MTKAKQKRLSDIIDQIGDLQSFTRHTYDYGEMDTARNILAALLADWEIQE